MNGRLYIDDIDAFAAWGVYLQDGSDKSVVQMPALKAVDTNEWAEYDGIEADLDNPVLDARQLTLAFHVSDITGADLFYDTLMASVYHDFRFPRLGKTYRLRLVSCGGISLYLRHGILTLTFSEDFCIIPSVLHATRNLVPSDGYRLDGVDLAKYGLRVTEGSEAQMRRWADIRQRPRYNSVHSAGTIYDEQGAVKVRSRDLALNLHVHTENMEDFWQRWNALFSTLIAPGEHKLTAFGLAYQCHYKSSTTKVFHITDDEEVWCDYSITLTVLSYGRVDSTFTVRVLATNDGMILMDDIDSVLSLDTSFISQ